MLPARPIRFFVLTAALALGGPAIGRADGLDLSSSYAVQRVSRTQPDPALRGRVEGSAGGFYGGIRAWTIPEPDRAGAVDVFFGARPKLGAVSVDVGFSRELEAECCGDVAIQVVRPLGRRGRLRASVRYDTAGSSPETEARASVAVARGYRVGAGVGGRLDAHEPVFGFDVGLSRKLTEAGSLDMRYRDAIDTDPRAELLLQARF
jgi:hypothetical protein